MKKLLPFLVLALSVVLVRADIHMPRHDNFYDKAGRGLANLTAAPAELLDSWFTVTNEQGGTAGFYKGLLVQGPSRMVMDMGFGLFEIVTSPFPPYESLKSKQYDTGIVSEYPPADLTNWY